MLMVYLQDANRASRLAELDSSGVRLLPALRSRLLKKTTARNVSGQLGDIAGKPAAVYVAGGRLWLAIDDQPWFFDDRSHRHRHRARVCGRNRHAGEELRVPR